MSRWDFAVVAVGAAPGNPPTFSESEAAADMAFSQHADAGVTAGYVIVKRDGTTLVLPFPTTAEASKGYDKAVSDPQDAWYIALYDKAVAKTAPFRVDETYLGGVETTPQTVRKTNLGPAKVLGAVGVATMLALFAAGRKRQRSYA